MSDLEYVVDPEESACECCGFDPVATYVFKCTTIRAAGIGKPPLLDVPTRLCKVCAESHISNSYNWITEDREVLTALAFCTNTILAELRKSPYFPPNESRTERL